MDRSKPGARRTESERRRKSGICEALAPVFAELIPSSHAASHWYTGRDLPGDILIWQASDVS